MTTQTMTPEEIAMLIPNDQTCADCIHKPRCEKVFGLFHRFGGDATKSASCDWHPSRFRPAPVN